jgi:MYXO-CTERM domain-containing protein
LLGACGAVEGAPHSGRPACAGTGLCGARCDGASRDDCSFPDDETLCGPDSCSNGARSESQRCDGAGECAEGAVTACPAYACDGDQCGTGCDSDADCTGDNICDGGQCQRNPLLDAVDRGSCGCRTPGGRAPGASALVALVALAFGAARRRTRRSTR